MSSTRTTRTGCAHWVMCWGPNSQMRVNIRLRTRFRGSSGSHWAGSTWAANLIAVLSEMPLTMKAGPHSSNFLNIRTRTASRVGENQADAIERTEHLRGLIQTIPEAAISSDIGRIETHRENLGTSRMARRSDGEAITAPSALAREIALLRALVMATVDHQASGIEVQVDALGLTPEAKALQQLFGNAFPLLLLLRGAQLVQEAVDARMIGKLLQAQQLGGDGIRPQFVVNILGPLTTDSERADQRLQFL